MNSSHYPDYIVKILANARLLLEEDDFSEPDTAALCFDVLALFPECQEASDLFYPHRFRLMSSRKLKKRWLNPMPHPQKMMEIMTSNIASASSPRRWTL